jgi:ribosomal RNA-processing protein 9
VTAALASEDGSSLYTASKDGSITQFSLRTGAALQTFTKVRTSTATKDRKGKKRADGNVEGHTDEVWALALSSDGRTLASGGKDRRVGVWDVESSSGKEGETGKWRAGYGGHRDGITARITFCFVESGMGGANGETGDGVQKRDGHVVYGLA